MAISDNSLRSTSLFQRNGADFLTIKSARENIVNDLKMIVDEINTIVGGDVSGSGTQNYVSKWNNGAGDNIGNSLLFDNGVSMAIGTATPNAASVFQLNSTTQGFQPPRMTTAQRNLIGLGAVNSATLIYNTTTSLFNYWDGSAWQTVDSSTTADTLAQVLASGRDVDATGTIKDFSSIDALDINSRYLITAGGIAVVRWNAQELYSSASIKALDWNNRQLIHGDGSTITADWGTRTLSGNWTAVTQAALDNSTKIATTAYVDSAVGAVSAWKLDGNTVGSEKWLGTVDNFDLPIRAFNTEVARVAASGYFGIGGGTPICQLDVTASRSSNALVIFKNTNASAGSSGLTSRVASTDAGDYIFQTVAYNGVGNIFQVFADGSSSFGTNTPSAKLHIKGAGATSATYSLKIDNSASTALLYVRDDGYVSVGDATNGNITMGVGSKFNPALLGNTFVGANIGEFSTPSGNYNACFGLSAGHDLTSGASNVFIGRLAGSAVTTGSNNVLVGAGAGSSAGDNRVFIGTNAGNINTNTCIAIGYAALGGTGATNTIIGNNSFGAYNNSGSDNSTLGEATLQRLNSGSRNVAIGAAAGAYVFLAASDNTYVGNLAGQLNNDAGTTGGTLARSTNTFIGSSAGQTNTGNSGVTLGYKSGMYETADSKLFIDNQDRTNEATARTNSLVYGIFAAATTNQYFTVNGHILTSEDLQFTTKVIDTTAGDSATINSPAGRFRKDTSGSTFTLTNSYITANSIILVTYHSDPGITGFTMVAVAGSGSMVVTFYTSGIAGAPTSNADVNFLVIN